MEWGFAAVAVGITLGVYISLKWNLPLFLLFVAFEGAAAIAYPREVPKFAHSYATFGLAWGTIPFLAPYYAQAGALSVTAVAASCFVGISVVMMHHLAIMTRESSDWKNALYLLDLVQILCVSDSGSIPSRQDNICKPVEGGPIAAHIATSGFQVIQ